MPRPDSCRVTHRLKENLFQTGWLVNATGNFNAAFRLMAALSLSSVLAVLMFYRPEDLRARLKITRGHD